MKSSNSLKLLYNVYFSNINFHYGPNPVRCWVPSFAICHSLWLKNSQQWLQCHIWL